MARRYMTKPRPRLDSDWYEADAVQSLARTVHEADNSPYPTGLFDASGNELYAVDEMEPIGFVRF